MPAVHSKKITRIYILVDITSSMSAALQGVIQAVDQLVNYMRLVGVYIILVFYGDYDRNRKKAGQVVKVLDSKSVTFSVKMKAVALSSLGGGGDITEAQVTALRYVSTVAQKGDAVVVIADACGMTGHSVQPGVIKCRACTMDNSLNRTICSVCHTRLPTQSRSKAMGCPNCSCTKYQRDQERDALRKLGVKDGFMTVEHFVALLQDGGVPVSLIKNKNCPVDSVFAQCAPYERLGQEHVFSWLVKIVSGYLGLSRELKGCPKVDFSPAPWDEQKVQDFRDLILLYPETFQSLKPLAKLYFKAVNTLGKKGLTGHSQFVQQLIKSNRVSSDLVTMFKAGQYEEKVLSTLQEKDDAGPRVYFSQGAALGTLTQVVEQCGYQNRQAGSPLTNKDLESMLKGLKLVDDEKEDREKFADGIPLSSLEKGNLPLLLSYLYRDEEGYYQPVGKLHLPIICCLILRHCQHLPKLVQLVSQEINKPSFLTLSDTSKLDPQWFNKAKLSDIRLHLLKKLPKEKASALDRLWRLVTVGQLFKLTIPVKYLLDVETMTVHGLIKYNQHVLVAFCPVLNLSMPPNLFLLVKDWNQFKTILDKLCSWRQVFKPRIADMAAHIKDLRALWDEMGKQLYISVYAINWYKEFVDGVEQVGKLDRYMYTEKAGQKWSGSLRDNYLATVGKNGERLFTKLVPQKDVPDDGIKVVVCQDCRACYSVLDSTNNLQRRCVQCRTNPAKRQADDRAPKEKITIWPVQCERGHKQVSAVEFPPEHKVPSSGCCFCQISGEATVEKCQAPLHELARENPKVFASWLGLPVDELEELLKAKNMSPFHTVHRLDEKSDQSKLVDPKFFTAKWKIPEQKDPPVQWEGCQLVGTADLKTLVTNNLVMKCPLCLADKTIQQFATVCSNEACGSQSCLDCIKHFHDLPQDHTGKIPANKIQCCFCRAPVKPAKKKFHSWFWRLLKRLVGENGKSLFTTLHEGGAVAKCSGEDCATFFEVLEERRCGPAGEEKKEEDCLCSGCIEKKGEQAVILEKDEALLNLADKYGFIKVEDTKLRYCPHCNALTERYDGCSHMTCKHCYKHWCWCCGTPFESDDDVYDHLSQVYERYFPTDQEIEQAHDISLVKKYE